MKYQFKTKSIELEVRRLRLHNAVNREVKPGRVKYLVNNMDPDALGRFAVWQDGRNFYVIDGQHRKLALEELGLPDWPVRCDVYQGMSFADACRQFLQLNNQLNVASFDKFDKGVKAGYEECVETKRIVEAAGFKIHPAAREGHLAAAQSAVDVYKLDRGESLEKTLRWVTGAWGHTASAAEGHILRGFGQVALRFDGAIDEPSLITKLAKYPGGPANLIGSARQRREFKGGSIGRNVAALVVDLYNKGRRSGALDPL